MDPPPSAAGDLPAVPTSRRPQPQRQRRSRQIGLAAFSQLIISCSCLIVAVAIGSLGLKFIGAGNNQRYHFETSIQKEQSVENADEILTPAANGGWKSSAATGHVFKNMKTRVFEGKRLKEFMHEYNPKNAARIINSSMTLSKNTIKSANSLCQAQKWGVVTTIFNPSDAILRLLSLGWCLVIVPDLKTPKDYMEKLSSLLEDKGSSDAQYAATVNLDRAFYLPVEEQELWAGQQSFFGSFVRSTPWNHFARKNVGYLFAILHKAEFIFDFDDDNYIKLGNDGLVLDILPDDSMNVTVAMLGGNAFNHHPMMGSSINASWARGFPLDLSQKRENYGTVAFQRSIPLSKVGVIQFLADNNPDIDAIHRITKPLPMNFQGNDSVLVPKHSFAPYNAQATVHTKLAFWALLLPSTVAGRVSDIWRSYFAQCIFADTDLRFVFAPPKITQLRNEHNNLGDFNAEQDLYNKAGELINYLSTWTSSETSVAMRLEHLYIDLYEHGYIELDDVERVQFWIGALVETGYQFPSFKGRHHNVAVMGQFNFADKESIITDVIFWAQKTREFFNTVIAVGPFDDDQVNTLRSNSISVRSSTADAGFYSPLSNFRNLLLEYKNSTIIEGILYIHDDAIMNVTQVAANKYPFPTHQILSNDVHDSPRLKCGKSEECKGCSQYRIFQDGRFEPIQKSKTFHSFEEWEKWSWCKWPHSKTDYCSGGQVRMAADHSLDMLREPDGSILFPGTSQSVFMFVPTQLADVFDEAVRPHLKHGIWIKCAFPKVKDYMVQWTQTRHRRIPLCTDSHHNGTRGTMQMVHSCIDSPEPSGIVHPNKISNGLEKYSRAYDIANEI